jgi:oligosaccharyltransferase complex subunit alpha (ribophorin I)
VKPSPPRGSRGSNQYSILDLKPRYPLLGGWNYSFTLGWDASLGDSTTWDPNDGRYIAAVPVLTPIPGAAVTEAEVSIVLPEGATCVL